MVTGKRIIYFDPRLCDGCGDCVEACATRSGVRSIPAIKLVKDEAGRAASVSVCLQCDQPFCVTICPTGSMILDGSKGLSTVRVETCIGCRSCFLICPVEAVFFDGLTDRAVKCDLCGSEPKCVNMCSRGALRYSLTDDLPSIKSDRVALLLSASTRAGNLTTSRGLAAAQALVGDSSLFSQIVSSRSEGIRRFLDYCAGNLATISREGALTTFSDTVLRRRRSLGLKGLKRPREEVQALLKALDSQRDVKYG